MNTPTALVQKLWNYRNVMRDGWLSYGDYVEQLTFLLFLKADEQSRPLINNTSAVPKGYDWPSLMAKDGDDLENPDAGWGHPAYNKGTEGDFVAPLGFGDFVFGLADAGDAANKSKRPNAVGPVPSPGVPLFDSVQYACHLYPDAGWGHPAYNKEAEGDFVARLNFGDTMFGLALAGDFGSGDTVSKSKRPNIVGPVPSPGVPIFDFVQCACHLYPDAGWGAPGLQPKPTEGDTPCGLAITNHLLNGAIVNL